VLKTGDRFEPRQRAVFISDECLVAFLFTTSFVAWDGVTADDHDEMRRLASRAKAPICGRCWLLKS